MAMSDNISAAFGGVVRAIAMIRAQKQDKLGFTPADASAVYTKTQVDGALGNKQDKLGFIPASAAALETKADLVGGKVPTAQLPDMSAVDSVAGLTGDIGAWALTGALGIRGDLGRQAVSLARVTGQIHFMTRGLADDFQTADGVDAAASTGEHYNAADNTFSGVPGAALVPMTAATAPAGHEVSASSVNSGNPTGFAAWKAFDGLDNTIWMAGSAALPQWLRRKVPAAAMVMSYSIQASDAAGGGNGPTAWTVRGSNNGTDWTTVDTRSGIVWSGAKQVQTFTVQSPGSYLYYELHMTVAASAAALQVIEWAMTTAPQNMSLRSAPFTATAAPGKAMLMVRASGSSALTAGVDLKGFVSRDDGVTWTEASLTAGIATGGFTTFEAPDIDLSAQPTGTAMKWRVDTVATKAPKIDAVVLQWNAGD